MINRTQSQLSTQSFLQSRPELICKPRISIRHNTRRNTVQTHNLLNIQFCQPLHRIIHSYRNKVSRLCQSVDNNPNRITVLLCPGNQTQNPLKCHPISIPEQTTVPSIPTASDVQSLISDKPNMRTQTRQFPSSFQATKIISS